MITEGLRLGVAASALPADPRVAARRCREMGAAGVQFDAASSSPDLTSLSASGLREFRRIFSSQDRQIVGLNHDLPAGGFSPGADVDRLLDRLDRVMETAAQLGSPLVCVDVGPLPAPAHVESPPPAITPLEAGLILLPDRAAPPPPPVQVAPPPDPIFVGQVQAALSELGRGADRYSVVVAFRSDLSSFASLAQVLAQVACPWFGVDLDPPALLADAWDMDELFSRLGPLIRHVRARDAVRGAGARTQAAVVGQGSTPWESLLANLDALGYRGWMTLNPLDLADRAAAASAGLKYLKALIA